MGSFKKLGASGLLLFITLFLFVSAAGQTGAPGKNTERDSTIKSLLDEVRLLRQTLQNTGLNASRGQILLERIKISNEQVVRLSRTVADTREQLEKTEMTIPRMSEQQKVVEAMLNTEVDPAKRARIEFESKELKRSVERYKNEIERLREREQQQATQLREEQSKLADLELRLQRLEDQIEFEVQRLKAEPNKP